MACSESDVKLLAPIDNPGKLLAVAGGYYASKDAARLGPDAQPLVFCKRTDDIKGPGDPITLWKMSPDVVDEIEIAIVIGTAGKDIPKERALDHVYGYTICNDVSGRSLDLPPAGRRDLNFDGFIDWLNGKWMDGFAILGPADPDQGGGGRPVRRAHHQPRLGRGPRGRHDREREHRVG